MSAINKLNNCFKKYRENEEKMFLAQWELEDMIPNVEKEIRNELSSIFNYNSYDLNSVCKNVTIKMVDDGNYVFLNFDSMDVDYNAIKEVKERVFPNNEFTLRSVDDCLIMTVFF